MFLQHVMKSLSIPLSDFSIISWKYQSHRKISNRNRNLVYFFFSSAFLSQYTQLHLNFSPSSVEVPTISGQPTGKTANQRRNWKSSKNPLKSRSQEFQPQIKVLYFKHNISLPHYKISTTKNSLDLLPFCLYPTQLPLPLSLTLKVCYFSTVSLLCACI